MTKRHVPLPRAIRIGPRTFQVSWQRGLHDRRQRRADGVIRYGPQVIVLHSSIRGFNVVDTLLHECVHGVCDQMEIKLSERQVERLSTGLALFLLDNSDLLTFLVGESAKKG